MTDALDSETRAVGEGADASPTEPAALACPSGIRQYVVILWDAAPSFALTLSTMISLVLLAAMAVLLMQELTKRTVTIRPISVYQEMASDGCIPWRGRPLLLLQGAAYTFVTAAR